MSKFLKDWIERIVKTAAAAAVPAFILPVTDLYNLSAWKGAALVAATAAGTAVLNLLTKAVGNPDTGSVLKPDA